MSIAQKSCRTSSNLEVQEECFTTINYSKLCELVEGIIQNVECLYYAKQLELKKGLNCFLALNGYTIEY